MRTISSELFNFQDNSRGLACAYNSEHTVMFTLWTIWTALRERLARYRRRVAHPWRMSGDAIGFGNRR
jgi:hypothetical protein